MTQVLLVVGVVVFFITVCGSIMVGGYLLQELADSEPEPAPVAARSAGKVAPTTVTPVSS